MTTPEHPAPDLRQAAVQIIAPHPALQHATFCYVNHGDGSGARMVQGWEALCLLMEDEVGCGPDERWRDILAELDPDHWSLDGNGVPFCWEQGFEDGSVSIYRLATLDAALSAPPAQEQAGQVVSDEREAFEAAYVRQYPATLTRKFERRASGNYFDGAVQEAWLMWQARALLSASPVQQEGAAPKGEAPEQLTFTPADGDLKALLDQVAYMQHTACIGGRLNHDDGVMFLNALDAVESKLATPARADAPIGEPTNTLRLVDGLIHAAKAAHAVRSRTDHDNVRPLYDAEDAAKKALLDHIFALATFTAAPAGQPATSSEAAKTPFELFKAAADSIGLSVEQEHPGGLFKEPRTQAAWNAFATGKCHSKQCSEAAPAPVASDELLSLLQRARLYTQARPAQSESGPFAAFRAELNAAIAAMENQQ